MSAQAKSNTADADSRPDLKSARVPVHYTLPERVKRKSCDFNGLCKTRIDLSPNWRSPHIKPLSRKCILRIPSSTQKSDRWLTSSICSRNYKLALTQDWCKLEGPMKQRMPISLLCVSPKIYHYSRVVTKYSRLS